MVRKRISLFYVYTDIRQNGEVFYVGKGSGPRFFVGLRRCNKHWMSLVLKEKGYKRVIVDFGLTEAAAFDLERALIKKHRATVVNFTNGGEGTSGRKLNPNTKAKISQALKGRVSPRKGVHLTDETKRKIAASKTGKLRGPHSEETKLKISKATKASKSKQLW